MSYNRNEFKEYVSGAGDHVVAAMAFTLEREADKSRRNALARYHKIVLDMAHIAGNEYTQRGLTYERFYKD